MSKPAAKFAWEDVDAIAGPVKVEVPLGQGFTAAEFGARYGLATSGTNKRIKDLVGAGKLVVLGWRRDAQGRLIIPVYAPKR